MGSRLMPLHLPPIGGLLEVILLGRGHPRCVDHLHLIGLTRREVDLAPLILGILTRLMGTLFITCFVLCMCFFLFLGCTHMFSLFSTSDLFFGSVCCGGVAVAIHKHCPFIPLDHYADPNGRFVFLKGTLFGRRLTLVALYAPNTRQLAFLDKLLDSLSAFREGQLVVGGDFNVCPDPQMDTSSGRSTHSFTFLKHVHKSLHTHHLVDCWRVLHPTTKDFSYYSVTHDVYTRIDLLLVDQGFLESLSSVSIGSITISDHAPISVSLTPPSSDTRQ